MPKLGDFGKQIRNTLKVLKCSTGESIKNSLRREQHTTYRKTRECPLDLSDFTYELRSKTRYWRKYLTDGKTWKGRKQLLDDFTEREDTGRETVDYTFWMTRFGRGYGNVAWHTGWWTKWHWDRFFLRVIPDYIFWVSFYCCSTLIFHSSSTCFIQSYQLTASLNETLLHQFSYPIGSNNVFSTLFSGTFHIFNYLRKRDQHSY